MNTVAVHCNNCGASLSMQSGTRFVTCRYCGASLKVLQNDSSVYTEVLEQIASRTEAIADNTDVIRLQNELERIDREWMMASEPYARVNKQGERYYPSPDTAIFMSIGGVAVGIFAMFFTSRAGGGFGLLVGLAIVALSILTGAVSFQTGHEYQRAKSAYEKRRARLVVQIAALETEIAKRSEV